MVELTALVAYADKLLEADRFTDYCPNGLQVEGRREVRRLVSGVTASQALIEVAVARGADALLVHHGYFWRGEDPRLIGIKQRRIKTLLEGGLSLIAYHLPLDAHPIYGNNAQLGARLGIQVDGSFNAGSTTGIGLYGHLPEPSAGQDFALHLECVLGRAPLHVPAPGPIRTLAWCTGAAQGFIQEAVALGVDAYLTGEVSESTVHIAREAGVHFFAAGHHATERYGVQALGAHLAEPFAIEHEFVDIDNPA